MQVHEGEVRRRHRPDAMGIVADPLELVDNDVRDAERLLP